MGVEFGLSKQTTAMLSPTIVLPLGIAVPIIATKIWKGNPLKQFMWAYKFRVTFVAFVDVLVLLAVRSFRGASGLIVGGEEASKAIFWSLLIASTAFQAAAAALQFNSQMTFFATRVDPAIGGSYMTLLNTFANLGGTWPSSLIMYLIGQYTVPPVCTMGDDGAEVCTGGRDAYFPLQLSLSLWDVHGYFLWAREYSMFQNCRMMHGKHKLLRMKKRKGKCRLTRKVERVHDLHDA